MREAKDAEDRKRDAAEGKHKGGSGGREVQMKTMGKGENGAQTYETMKDGQLLC